MTLAPSSKSWAYASAGTLAGLLFAFFVSTWTLKALDLRPPGWHGWLAFSGYLDVLRYETIAEQGYVEMEARAFFPLWPLAIRGIHGLTGLPFNQAACVTSFLALLGLAVVFGVWLHKSPLRELPQIHHPFTLGILGGTLLGFQPAMIFLAIPYNEALFITLFLSFIMLWEKRPAAIRLWRLSALAVLAALMASLRPNGIFIALAAGAAGFIALFRAEKRSVVVAETLASGMGTAVALALFSYYMFMKSGDPLAFWHARSAWNEDPGFDNLTSLFTGNWGGAHMTRILCVYIVLAGAWLEWKAKRSFTAIACALMVLLPYYQGKVGDMHRHALMAFPATVAAFVWLRRWPAVLVGISLILVAASQASWIQWALRRWVG